MRSIRKSLLPVHFLGSQHAAVERQAASPWNFSQLDKQAHKMIAAFLLWQQNTAGMSDEEQRRIGIDIIEGGIFDYFYRLIITDIKPPVFYRIKANSEHYRELTAWDAQRTRTPHPPAGRRLLAAPHRPIIPARRKRATP